MNFITTMILVFLLSVQTTTYSQRNFQHWRFVKKHPLNAKIVKAEQKEGKTILTVNTILINRSKDTLYYFSGTCSETYNYSTDTTLLLVNSKRCDTAGQIVIAIPPKGHRNVSLEIFPQQPLTISIDFRVVFFLFKAKDRQERIPENELWRRRENTFILFSNHLKT